MTRAFLLPVAVGCLALAGCGSRSPSDEPRGTGAAGRYDPAMATCCQRACAARVPYEESQLVQQPGARPGDLTRCPVSGVVFLVEEANHEVAHGGGAYSLCCDVCAIKFREDPGRFAGS